MKNYIIICTPPSNADKAAYAEAEKAFEGKIQKSFLNAKRFKGEQCVWGVSKSKDLPGDLWLMVATPGLAVNVLEASDEAFIKAF